MENGQAAIWNGDAGQAWIETRDLLDDMFRPFERMLAAWVAEQGKARVLDVGCGTGSTTLAIARTLGAHGQCLGVDISAPMICLASQGAEVAGARFLCCDAGQYPFAAASFDAVVSRFGVMFFDEPVAAFANLRRAACDGAALRCFAWRGADENPFMTAAERAVQVLMPGQPRQSGAPGQFAFAMPERVHAVLAGSGWRGIDIEPIDVVCALPASSLPPYVCRMGSVGRTLTGLPEPLRTKVVEQAVAAFKRFDDQGTIRYRAACWDIRAHA